MLKNLFKVGLVIGIFALMTSTVVNIADNASQRKADHIFVNNYNNVLWVGYDYRHGTGVLVKAKSGKLVVLTNRHVCEALPGSAWLSNSIISTTAEILYMDTLADLCVIHMPKQLEIPGAVLSPIEPRLNQEIYTMGYPLEHDVNLMAGRVIGPATIPIYIPFINQTNCLKVVTAQGMKWCVVKEKLVATNVIAFAGGSGSPVFNSNNELVGLISASAIGSNFGHMVYLKDIKRVLNKF